MEMIQTKVKRGKRLKKRYCDIYNISKTKTYATIAQRMGGIKWKYTVEKFIYTKHLTVQHGKLRHII